MNAHRPSQLWIALCTTLTLAACGGGGDEPNEPGGPNLDEFQVNTSAIANRLGDNNTVDVSIGADNRFMVVWYTPSNVLAQRIEANGRKDGTELTVSRSIGLQPHASVGIGAQGQATFAFTRNIGNDEYAIFARRYQSDGTPAGEEVQISSSYGSGTDPVVGVSSSGASVIVWAALNDGFYSVRGRLIGADGAMAASELLIARFRRDNSSPYAPSPSLSVAPDGSFLVMWNDSTGMHHGQRYGSGGTKAGAEFSLGRLQVGGYSAGMRSDGSFAAAYGRDGHVFLQRFDAQGSRIGGELQVDTSTGIAVGGTLSIASDGKFAVSWSHFPSSTSLRDALQVQRFAADGSRVGSEFRAVDATADPGNFGSSALALSTNGHLLVTWFTRGSLRARLFAE